MSVLSIEETDASRECPECGEEAVAIIMDSDPQTTTMCADDACEVSRSDLSISVGWLSGAPYIHGGDAA
jgi:hypothetical protein